MFGFIPPVEVSEVLFVAKLLTTHLFSLIDKDLFRLSFFDMLCLKQLFISFKFLDLLL